jgi:predicted dehydrogenase
MGPRIRTDVTIIEDYLIHDLYIALELFGLNLKDSYTTLAKSFEYPIMEDTVSSKFQLDDVLCDVFSSWRFPIKKRELIITGDKGSFIWINDSLSFSPNRYIKIDDRDKFGNIGYELITEDTKDIVLNGKSSLETELEAFIDSKLPSVTVSDVWNLMEVLKGE